MGKQQVHRRVCREAQERADRLMAYAIAAGVGVFLGKVVVGIIDGAV